MQSIRKSKKYDVLTWMVSKTELNLGALKKIKINPDLIVLASF
jgi:hypothetical protein